MKEAIRTWDRYIDGDGFETTIITARKPSVPYRSRTVIPNPGITTGGPQKATYIQSLGSSHGLPGLEFQPKVVHSNVDQEIKRKDSQTQHVRTLASSFQTDHLTTCSITDETMANVANELLAQNNWAENAKIQY
ncbi:uncharacterized protein N7515_008792 [Penicillium bovifimosum]|uniref:Uncharacterized protein n=1 Tax=Penicillium bovifimosum TaxID=126998 RepID=A0A9W9GPX4_9EURO|nr:uncharacterized protein N7515_008792 [Penicillium bovifimosum]KAJ5124967.1 hypothetical protein N7515_008792 [Penicillium bovifimosum]